jgi:hypothetical protein
VLLAIRAPPGSRVDLPEVPLMPGTGLKHDEYGELMHYLNKKYQLNVECDPK